MNNGYTDPLVKIWGSVAIIIVGLTLFAAGAYAVIIWQIDNQVDYCPATKTNIPVRDCKEVR